MAKNMSLKALNEREPKPAMILRLLAEAQAGKKQVVSIPEMLEFRRDQYGLKAAEFAAILGLTAPKYSEVISGRRNMPLNARIRAFAIGVPADVLLQPGSEMARAAKADTSPQAQGQQQGEGQP